MDLSVLEKRGTSKLLVYLHRNAPCRFKDLSAAIPRQATLAKRIKELESVGLIEAVPVTTKKAKFFAYKLTTKGKKLMDFFQSL